MPYFQRKQALSPRISFYVLDLLVYNGRMDPAVMSTLFEKAVGKPLHSAVSLKTYSIKSKEKVSIDGPKLMVGFVLMPSISLFSL